MSTIVYKITKVEDWKEAKARGSFFGSRDDSRDGFIHLSAEHQVRDTLEKHFSGEDDLVLIAFEAEALGPSLRWEASRGGDLFPHLYADLPASRALWQRTLIRSAEGHIHLDEEWFRC